MDDLAAMGGVQILRQRTSLDRVTRKLTGTVEARIANPSTRMGLGPLHLVVNVDSAAVQVPNALGGTGQVPHQAPYFDLSSRLTDGRMPAGSSITCTVSFVRNAGVEFRFALKPLIHLNRAPVLRPGGPYATNAEEDVVFDASGTTDPEGHAMSFAWQFADGATARTARATHRFRDAGSHAVRLSVTDEFGAESATNLTVMILPLVRFALARTRSLDGVGHPLGAVRVLEEGPAGTRTNVTDEASGYVALGQQAGSYAWRFEKDGYLPVWREARLVNRTVAILPNPWLAARSTNVVACAADRPTRVPAPDGTAAVSFPATAFAGPASAVLTTLEPQTLPSVLPAGWIPLSAFWIELSATPTAAGQASLTLRDTLAAGERAALVRWDETHRFWSVVEIVTGKGACANCLTEAPVRGPGAYAVAAPDRGDGSPPAAVVGEPLAPALLEWPEAAALTAEGRVTPAVAAASRRASDVTALATAVFTSSNPLPSGVTLRCAVDETYRLKDGPPRKTPNYETFVVAYQRPGDADPRTLHAWFPVRPRLLFASDTLSEALIRLDVLPRGEFTGAVLDGRGGVASDGPVRIDVAAGALDGTRAVEVRSLDPLVFAGLLGLDTNVVIAAFELNLGGLNAGRALAAAFGPQPTNSNFVLARVVSTPDAYGLEPVERFATDAAGVLDSQEGATPRLPGILGSGQYVLVRVEGASGLVSGVARNHDGAVDAGLLVTLPGRPWLFRTGSDGQYRLVVPLGGSTVQVRDPVRGNEGTGQIDVTDTAVAVSLDVATVASGPRVLSVDPADGQSNVSWMASVSVVFSEPVDASTWGTNGIRVRGTNGQDVAGTLTLSPDGRRGSFLAERPWAALRPYAVEVSAAIADLAGLPIEGRRTFGFVTEPARRRTPGAQLIVYEPGATNCPALHTVPGYNPSNRLHVCVEGTQGTADPEVPVVIVNYDSGATATVRSRPDGSFVTFIEAAEDHMIAAVFINANGTRIEVPASRQLFDDGRIGLYAGGGILEAQSDGGPVQVFIEPNGINTRAVFKIDAMDWLSVLRAVSNTLPENAQLLGGFRFEMQGDVAGGPSDVSLPVDSTILNLPPGTAPEDATYGLAIVNQIDGQTVYQLVDKLAYRNGRLTSNTFPFMGLLMVAGAAMTGHELWKSVAVPILFGGKNQTVEGITYVCTNTAFGPYDCPASDMKRLSGVFVTVDRPENVGGGGRIGKIRPGMMYTTSGQDGTFAVLVPVDKYQYAIVGTHPRYHQHAEAMVAALEEFPLSGPIRKRLVFLMEENEIDPARVSMAHVPLLPSPREVARLLIDAPGGNAAPTVTVTLDSVLPLVPGQSVSQSDATLSNVSTRVVGNRTLATAYVWATNAVVAHMKVSVQGHPDLSHDIPFGASLSSGGGGGQVRAADTNDHSGPTIIATWPAQGAVLEPGAPIYVNFNEPIDRDVLARTANVTIAPPAGLPTLALFDRQQTLELAFPALEPGQSYALTVPATAVKNLIGKAMDADASTPQNDDLVLSFRTAPAKMKTLSDMELGGGAALLGGCAFCLDRGGPGAVKVYDVSDPTNPTRAKTIPYRPGFPRDLVVIPRYRFVPAKNAAPVTRDLLAVVGGKLGLVSDDAGMPYVNGQYLTIYDVTDLDLSSPDPPPVLVSVVLTLRPSAVTKVRWNAPYLIYLETGADLDQVGLIDLQTMLIGFGTPASDLPPPGQEVRGVDKDMNGDYLGSDDTVPIPARPPIEFYGKESAFVVTQTNNAPFPPPLPRIVDFDFDYRAGYCGVVLASQSGDGRTGYRTFMMGGAPVDPGRGSLWFAAGVQAQRLTGLMFQQVGSHASELLTLNLALVSLSPDGSNKYSLAVLDVTVPANPVLSLKIAFPGTPDLGIIRTVFRREDGLLALTAADRIVVMDPLLLLQPNPTNALAFHPAVRAIVPNIGSGHPSLASTVAGLHVANHASGKHVLQTAPRLRFVSHTNRVLNVSQLVADTAAVWFVVTNTVPVEFLAPGRFRSEAGASNNLTTPSPLAHYYVWMDAPGGAGATVELGLESLNLSGWPLKNKGLKFPPVRALSDKALADIKQEPRANCDAPIRSLTAYRLSDNKASALYNIYLSKPFALTYENMTADELKTLKSKHDREILWSGYYLRAIIDPKEDSNTVLKEFAGKAIPNKQAIAAGASVRAVTFPAPYIMGANPPPIGGATALPGTYEHVSAHNAEMRPSAEDLALPGRRLPIEFERQAGGQDLYVGPFGRGWDFNYNQHLSVMDGGLFPPGSKMPLIVRAQAGDHVIGQSEDVLLHTGEGRLIQFAFKGVKCPPEMASDPLVKDLRWDTDAKAFYLPEKGCFDLLLRFEDKQFVRLTPDGMQYWYSSRGRLERIYDRYSKNWQQLSYNSRGELARISDMSADPPRFVDIGYWRLNGDSDIRTDLDEGTDKKETAGKIRRLRDYAGRDVLYTYTDDEGILNRVENVNVTAANGGFGGRQRTDYLLETVCSRDVKGVQVGAAGQGGSSGGTPEFSASALQRDPQDKPFVRDGSSAGGTLSVTRSDPQNTAKTVENSNIEVTEPDDTKTKITFDKYAMPKEYSVKRGQDTRAYSTKFNEYGLLEEITYPEGNKVKYTYDVSNANWRARGNLLKVQKVPDATRGGATLTAEYSTYEGRYNLLTGSTMDFNSNTVTYTLTSNYKDIEKIEYGSDGVREFTYDEYGMVTSETTPEGVKLEYGYDTDTGFRTAEKRGGIQTAFSYDDTVAAKLGMPTSTDRPEGDDVTLKYDERLGLTERTQGPLIEKRAYDANRNLKLIDRDLGNNQRYVEERDFNSVNFMEALRLKNVEVNGSDTTVETKFTPDTVWRVSKVRQTLHNPEDVVTVYTRDAMGDVTGVQVGSYAEEFPRDRNGNVKEVKRGGETTETLTYDGHDRVATRARKTGGGDVTTVFTYYGNDEPRRTTVRDSQGNTLLDVEVTALDALGRPKEVVEQGEPDDAMTTFTYAAGANGQTVVAAYPRNTVTTTYDSAGRIATRSDSLHPTVTFTPDGNGNVKMIRSEEGSPTTTTYTENRTYTGLDYLETRTDDEGSIVTYDPRPDGQNRSEKENGMSSKTTRYGLSVLGERTSIARPNGVNFLFKHDPMRHLSYAGDNSKGREYAYDTTLRLETMKLPSGENATYSSFDPRNHPQQIALPGGSIAMQYDLQGRPTRQETTYDNVAFTVSYEDYDALDRILSVKYGDSAQYTATYTYDLLGPIKTASFDEPGGPFDLSYAVYTDKSRKSVTYSSGVTVNEDRTAGRLGKVTVGAETVYEVQAFKAAEIPDEVFLAGGAIREKTLYDLRKRVLARRYTRVADGTLLADVRYQYQSPGDNVTVRQFIHRNGRADTFDYDAGDRLTLAHCGARPNVAGAAQRSFPGFTGVAGLDAGFYSRAHAYDVGGLDLLVTNTVVNPDALDVPPFAGTIGSHDAFRFPGDVDGTATASDSLGNARTWRLAVRSAGSSVPQVADATLTHDALNHLVTIEHGDVSIAYQYQHSGLCHRRTVTRAGTTVSDRGFVWDSHRNLIEEYDVSGGAGSLLARYIYADSDAPVAAYIKQSDGAFRWYYYLRAADESVMAVATADGRVVERVTYDPWGQPAIEVADVEPPRIARITTLTDGVAIQFSEPVLPPLQSTAEGSDIRGSTLDPATRFTVNGLPPPAVVYDESYPGAPFGTVVRLTFDPATLGAVTLAVSAGTVVDEWGNAAAGQNVDFLFDGTPDLVVFQDPAVTAPQRVERSTVGSPFLFHGQYFDYDAGLVYLRARWYDPHAGMFLEPDPEGYEDSVNLYAAFGHNPVNFRDPEGTFWMALRTLLRLRPFVYGAIKSAALYIGRGGGAAYRSASAAASLAYSPLRRVGSAAFGPVIKAWRASRTASKAKHAAEVARLSTLESRQAVQHLYQATVLTTSFKCKLWLANAASYIRTWGKSRFVTAPEILDVLGTKTVFRVETSFLWAEADVIAKTGFVIRHPASRGFFSSSAAHHELLHVAQFLRDPNLRYTAAKLSFWGRLPYEVVPLTVGSTGFITTGVGAIKGTAKAVNYAIDRAMDAVMDDSGNDSPPSGKRH